MVTSSDTLCMMTTILLIFVYMAMCYLVEHSLDSSQLLAGGGYRLDIQVAGLNNFYLGAVIRDVGWLGTANLSQYRSHQSLIYCCFGVLWA